jgi:hypothetical protein
MFSCSRRMVNGVGAKRPSCGPRGAGVGALMKQFDAEAGGRKSLPSGGGRLASAAVLTALALIAASGAKADVVETFNLSGSFNSFLGPLVPFTGTVDLDFSNDFAVETLQSITICVQGRPVFNRSVSLSVSPSVGIIGASNSAGDTLSLWFAAPQSGTWAGFDAGEVSFGDVIFGGLTGLLLGATGDVTRDLCRPRDTRPSHSRPAARNIRRRSRALDLGDAAARPRGPRPRGEGSACVGLPGETSLSRIPLWGPRRVQSALNGAI